MNEHNTWKQLRSLINTLKGHASRIESHETANGFPDVDFCIDGVDYKMELKFTSNNGMPDIRPSQVIWFRDRVKAGGKPFVVIEAGGRGGYFLFVRGKFIYELSQMKHLSEIFDIPENDVYFLARPLNLENFKLALEYMTGEQP